MFRKMDNFDSQDGESLIERNERNQGSGEHRLKLVTAAKEVIVLLLLLLPRRMMTVFFLILLSFFFPKKPDLLLLRFEIQVLEKHGNLAVPIAILLTLGVSFISSIFSEMEFHSSIETLFIPFNLSTTMANMKNVSGCRSK